MKMSFPPGRRRDAARVILGLVLPLLAGCASLAGSTGTIGGKGGTVRARLVSGEKALKGARITAVSDFAVGFRERRYEAEADGNAEAVMNLPPGVYYLTALSSDGSYFGYYGPNPVAVREGEELSVTIRGLEGNRPPAVLAGGEGSAVEGQVVTGGEALAGATVAFYLDPSTQFRGPAYMEVATDGEGRFAAALSPGRYFAVVRKRSSGGERYGPLAVGDHFGYYAFNPVPVREGERVAVGIAAVEVLRRAGWSGPSSLRTRIGGVVRTRRGEALPGYRAFLHSRADMLGKPDFVSEDTGEDGRYEIWAEREGTYYLGARREIGKAREKGETVGLFEGTPDHSVVIRLDGSEMKGFDVVVEDGGTAR